MRAFAPAARARSEEADQTDTQGGQKRLHAAVGIDQGRDVAQMRQPFGWQLRPHERPAPAYKEHQPGALDLPARLQVHEVVVEVFERSAIVISGTGESRENAVHIAGEEMPAIDIEPETPPAKGGDGSAQPHPRCRTVGAPTP